MDNYKYIISYVNEKEKWIFIEHENFDEPDAFVALVKKIKNKYNGKIVEVGFLQYKIEGDKVDLIYQYDALFWHGCSL